MQDSNPPHRLWPGPNGPAYATPQSLQQILFVKKRVFNQLLIFAFGLASLASSAPGQQGRYLAVLGDGRRVAGDKLTGWHVLGGTVRLGDTVVVAPGKPLQWMRDRALQAWRPTDEQSGYIEFVGGDRIVGRVLGGQAEVRDGILYVPAHVVVRPASTMRLPTHGDSVEAVRVLPDSIRRVVFMPGLRYQFQPGTVFYREGRRVGFDRIRWREGSVRLLLKDGTLTVSLSDIAEIHMPRRDPWQIYYRELAVLDPGCRFRMVRFETTDGLIATGSESRVGAKRFRSDSILHQAEAQRKRYDREIERLETACLKYRQRLDKCRADYDKQTAAIEAGIKRDKIEYDKALAELKSRHEKEQKDDAAKLVERRKKLEETYRKEIEALEKLVAKTPEAKRNRYKSLRAAKKRSFEKALRSLDQEVQGAETKKRANLRKIEKLEKDRVRNLKYVAQAKEKLESSRALVVAAAERRGQYGAQLASYKDKRDALPGPDGNPNSWLHMIQPAWSLEPLWVPFETIRMRWSFPVDKFPLSRADPTKAVSPAMLKWRADRNSDGGLLRSGGRLHGWGFGVHAYSELSFALPSAVVAFNSRLGLDRLVEAGGCVRAKVYLGSIKTKPVYESALLIGSKKTIDTGAIRIPSSPKAPINLILQVDPAIRDHPPQADPLNIRDKFDWLEPQLAFDPGRLRGEVSRYIGSHVGAWRGWTAKFDKRGVYTWGSWYDWGARGERGIFLPALRTAAQPLKLSKEMTVPAGDKWLVVDVGFPGGGDLHPKVVALHIGDEEIQPAKIPIKQYWRRWTAPLVFPIEKYRGKKIKLELSQKPDGKDLYWRGIGTSKELPSDYRLAHALAAAGKKDMIVSRGLGLTLQSGRIRKADALEALEVMRLGGYVTFCNEVTGQLRYEYLYGVMIGSDWTGGDAAFGKLKDMRWVRMVLVSNDSGVSTGAIAKLKAAKGENFVVRQVQRTPSAWGGMSCTLTVRNRRDKEVMIFHIHGWGGLTNPREIKPGSEVKMHTHEGFRYEAHSLSKDYNKSKPISRCVAKGDTVWEIK